MEEKAPGNWCTGAQVRPLTLTLALTLAFALSLSWGDIEHQAEVELP